MTPRFEDQFSYVHQLLIISCVLDIREITLIWKIQGLSDFNVAQYFVHSRRPQHAFPPAVHENVMCPLLSVS